MKPPHMRARSRDLAQLHDHLLGLARYALVQVERDNRHGALEALTDLIARLEAVGDDVDLEQFQ